MKISFHVALALSFFTVPLLAQAGHEIGNGSGAWVCRNSAKAALWAEPVDVWEARYEFGLNVPEIDAPYLTVLDQFRARIAAASPQFALAIAADLERIHALKPEPPHVMYTIDILEVIDDSLFRLRPHPRRCANGTIAYEQVVNYKMDGNILLQSEIFTELNPSGVNIYGPVDRVATVLHEAIYAYRRRVHHDQNSVITRRLVGLIVSDFPIEQLRVEIAHLDK